MRRLNLLGRIDIKIVQKGVAISIFDSEDFSKDKNINSMRGESEQWLEDHRFAPQNIPISKYIFSKKIFKMQQVQKGAFLNALVMFVEYREFGSYFQIFVQALMKGNFFRKATSSSNKGKRNSLLLIIPFISYESPWEIY